MASSQGSLKSKRTNKPGTAGMEFKVSKRVLEGYFVSNTRHTMIYL
jgi:hypothetical protein